MAKKLLTQEEKDKRRIKAGKGWHTLRVKPDTYDRIKMLAWDRDMYVCDYIAKVMNKQKMQGGK